MEEKSKVRKFEGFKFKKDLLLKRNEPPVLNVYRAYSIYFREAWRNALKRYS